MISKVMRDGLSLCLKPVENAFSLPPLAYTSSEALTLEKKSIFWKVFHFEKHFQFFFANNYPKCFILGKK